MFRTADVGVRFNKDLAQASREREGLRSAYLNDRQADEPMATFDELTSHLSVQGHSISEALRYAFFSDCLRSSDYINYSALQRTIIPAGWAYELQAADVVFAQEGNAERENRLTLPILNCLRTHGLSGGRLRLAPIGRGRRLWISLATMLSRSRELLSPKELDSLDHASARLMEVFGLNSTFRGWFRMQVALSLNRYRRAQVILNSARPKPRVVVVNSEYHPTSRALLIAARSMGIPTVLVQHGFLGQSWLHWPILSDKICVWGDVDRDWYVERGLSEDRITTTGIHSSFGIDPSFRIRIRREHSIREGQGVVGFFAPNLGRDYHARAARFLMAAKSKLNSSCKWFVRPHPSQAKSDLMSEYNGFEMIGASVPLEEVFALTDVVLHDYSTMASAQFAGLETVCVELDPPYPSSYRSLLGGQTVVDTPDALCDRLSIVIPGYQPVCGPTTTMAAGGEEALNKIGRIIRESASALPGTAAS